MITQAKTARSRSPAGGGEIEKPEHLAAEIDRLRRSCASLRGRNDQLQRKLCFANESKARFLGSVAHELRTPLGSLLILADLLAENRAGRLSAEEVEHARNIRRAGIDVREILDQVLELTRVEAGLLELRPEPVDLQALLTETSKELRPLAESKGLELQVETPERPPETILADRKCLEQIVRALLGNALRSTVRRQSAGALRLARETVGTARRRITIEVEDEAYTATLESRQRSLRISRNVLRPLIGN
ncbi:MAG: hypothetical protein HC897_01515 [Thermoanaerobaculia bacterium]|nr:hypothetical protein [Thermoanaerobaculia bacterium]